mgnify:FL=1|tara:strand:+ start:2779 stop:3141 length:363 start_codon:yes stop_codon:yes gene_type:complete
MPLITITFPNPLNVSVQVGDIAWFVPSINTTTLPSATAMGNLTEIGPVTQVGLNFIIVNVNSALWASGLLSVNDFIMFAKDNQANMSSLLGYFSRFRFSNNSHDPAELFSVSAEYFESSK